MIFFAAAFFLMFADRDSDDDDGYGEDDNDDDEAHHPIKQALATAHFARRQVSKRSNLAFLKTFPLKYWNLVDCNLHHLLLFTITLSTLCSLSLITVKMVKNVKRKR